MSGKLIVITGLDGSGTSTLAAALYALDAGSHLMRTPMAPFDQARQLIDEHVREDSQAAHYLFYLSSVVHASARIEKLLETGNVYCVRYLIDSVISHRAAGLNVELEYETSFYAVRKPDITLCLTINEEVRQSRITTRGKGLLDKILDDDEHRKRFEREFDRLSDHFVMIDNSNRTLEQLLLDASRHLPWITVNA
jgi:thymidylate kinase